MSLKLTEYITPQEAGERLNVTTGWIYRLIDAGKLPGVKIGHAVLIPAEAVEARRAMKREAACPLIMGGNGGE